jgi:hypothetical protein
MLVTPAPTIKQILAVHADVRGLRLSSIELEYEDVEALAALPQDQLYKTLQDWRNALVPKRQPR